MGDIKKQIDTEGDRDNGRHREADRDRGRQKQWEI